MKESTKALIPWIFYGLIGVFLVIYVQRTEFSRIYGLDVSVGYLLIATVLALILRYWGAFVWFVILKSLGATELKEKKRELVYVYAKAWLGRYVPGKVPWLLGKIYFASQQGISKQKLAVSSLLEGALQIVATLSLAILLLILDSRLDIVDWPFKLSMVGILCGCIFILIPKNFNRLNSGIYQKFTKRDLSSAHHASRETISKGVLLNLVGAVLNGVSFFFIAKAIYPELGIETIPFIVGTASLAGAIGMLAVFVPSGLGVREAVQVLLLSVLMPIELAILIAIVMRIWSIAVDFLFLGMSMTYARRRIRI